MEEVSLETTISHEVYDNIKTNIETIIIMKNKISIITGIIEKLIIDEDSISTYLLLKQLWNKYGIIPLEKIIFDTVENIIPNNHDDTNYKNIHQTEIEQLTKIIESNSLICVDAIQTGLFIVIGKILKIKPNIPDCLTNSCQKFFVNYDLIPGIKEYNYTDPEKIAEFLKLHVVKGTDVNNTSIFKNFGVFTSNEKKPSQADRIHKLLQPFKSLMTQQLNEASDVKAITFDMDEIDEDLQPVAQSSCIDDIRSAVIASTTGVDMLDEDRSFVDSMMSVLEMSYALPDEDDENDGNDKPIEHIQIDKILEGVD